MPEPVLQYHSEGIVASLRHSSRTLVGPVDFTVGQGEKMAIIGETGSGKTLTALSIMGLLPPNVDCLGLRMRLECKGGRVHEGDDVFRTAGSAVVYIPQNGLESLNPSRTVKAHIQDMLKKNGCPKEEMSSKAFYVLKSAGFMNPRDVIDLYPFQLSGGMAQRVTIALAMTGRESLVIADEPTNGLDHAARRNFIEILDSCFPKAGKIIITHDMTLADISDSVLVLQNGVVMEQGPSSVVLGNPRCEYTRALRGALVRNGMKETPRLRGEDPCCPFYCRCEKACEACRTVAAKAEGSHSWRCI